MKYKAGEQTDSQVQSACVSLRELAFRLGPGIKLPTVNDLCQSLKISRYTLTDALDILEEQNVLYRRQGSGIYVSPKLHRKSVCILFSSYFISGNVLSPFWGILWSLFAREMERRNALGLEYYSFHLMIQDFDNEKGPTESLPEDVIAMIRARKIQGVLAVGLLSSTYTWLCEQGIPSVTFAGLGMGGVNLDNVEESRQAVNCLLEQGCQRVGFWSFTSNPYVHLGMSDIQQVFCEEVARQHAVLYPELIKSGDPGLFFSAQKQGYQLVMETFGNPDTIKPDGIYISDDMVTSGALPAFRDLGIQVGKDIKIVTHGNTGSPMLFGEEKHLTILALDTKELVTTMFDLLQQFMNGQTPEDSSIFLKTKILSLPDQATASIGQW